MTNEQKVGLFFFIGVVLVFTAVEMTMGTGLFTKGYHLWVRFSDVQGLTTGDKVLSNRVPEKLQYAASWSDSSSSSSSSNSSSSSGEED